MEGGGGKEGRVERLDGGRVRSEGGSDGEVREGENGP